MSDSSAPTRSRLRRRETGQETLQAILVVSGVLIPVMIAILSFGAAIHVYIGAQGAAAAGARAAGAAGEFGPAEHQRVVETLRSNGIDPARCSIEPPGTVVVSLDAPISVTVRCPEDIGIPFVVGSPFHVDLSSTFVSRGEVNR